MSPVKPISTSLIESKGLWITQEASQSGRMSPFGTDFEPYSYKILLISCKKATGLMLKNLIQVQKN